MLLSHLTGRGTWIGLVIRLDVDLALGQHLRKLPLQLLILLVVGDSVNRSTESSSETREVNREKNSQKNFSNTELVFRKPPGARSGRTSVNTELRRNRREARGKGKARCSECYRFRAGHLTDAPSTVTQTEQWGDTGNRFNYKSLRQRSQGKRLYYIFPFNVNKCFLAKALHTTNENRGLL